MVEYKVILLPTREAFRMSSEPWQAKVCELLNTAANGGWRLCAVSDGYAFLERVISPTN